MFKYICVIKGDYPAGLAAISKHLKRNWFAKPVREGTDTIFEIEVNRDCSSEFCAWFAEDSPSDLVMGFGFPVGSLLWHSEMKKTSNHRGVSG